MNSSRFVLIGGAGFIGSHFTDRLLADPATERIVLYDNFSSGRERHYAHHRCDSRLEVVRADVCEWARLVESLRGAHCVVHLASNPDIARAAEEPDIDFIQGTELTNYIVEAMRAADVRRILYASGSGVYGELGDVEAREDHGPLHPVSTYGASKLAGESLICAYAHLFGWRACAFRFANVVGARQTHGVGFDFVRRLRKDPTRLRILGNGKQSKSYVWVEDVVDAVLLAAAQISVPFQVYNVATRDHVTVTEIADLAVSALGYAPGTVPYEYTGGDRGWKGDVPVVRLATERIRALGWAPSCGSRQALAAALHALVDETESGGDA